MRDAYRERGSAMVWALLLVVMTSGMVYTHTTFLTASRKERSARHNRDAIADTFARSGVTEALGWYRRQSQQPVTTFAPRLDPDGNPPRYETIDPTLGLVREFEIHGNLWGRYEIRSEEVVDISAERGNLAPGSVWELAVRSYVYRIADPAVPFDQAPNRMVATKRVETEIRNVRFNPPVPSAVCVEDPARIEVGRDAVIDGNGAAAIAYTDPAAMAVQPVVLEPAIDALADVRGVPPKLALSLYDSRSEKLFGMRLDELRQYADVVIISGKTPWPRNADGQIYVEDAIVFVDGDVFGTAGVTFVNCLVVYDGMLKKWGSVLTTIEGVILVTGDAYLNGRYEIRGSLIVQGNLQLGTDGEQVVVTYDADVVESIRQMLKPYRERRGRRPGRGDRRGRRR